MTQLIILLCLASKYMWNVHPNFFHSFFLPLSKMCMGSLACAQTLIRLVCFPYIFCLLHLCNQNLTLSFNNYYFLIDKFHAPTQNFTLRPILMGKYDLSQSSLIFSNLCEVWNGIDVMKSLCFYLFGVRGLCHDACGFIFPQNVIRTHSTSNGISSPCMNMMEGVIVGSTATNCLCNLLMNDVIR